MQALICTRCGAPLPGPKTEGQTHCAYCGTSFSTAEQHQAAPASAKPAVYVDELIKGYVRALLSAACSSRFAAGRRAGPPDEEEIVAAARDVAAGCGRTYVIPSDVQTCAPKILARFLTAPPGAKVEDTVRAIVGATPVP